MAGVNVGQTDAHTTSLPSRAPLPPAQRPSSAQRSSSAPKQPRAVRQVAATGRRKRQVPWVVAGLLIVTGSALGFALWADTQSQRTNALVAAVDIPVGAPITRTHLREVSIGVVDEVAVLPSSQLNVVVGQIAQTGIPTGTILGPQHLGANFEIPVGRAVVGASLTAGAYPLTGLRIGDPVRLYEVANSQKADAEEFLIGEAEVWAVEPIELGGEPRIFLSLLVEDAAAGLVTNAVARDRLHVVLTPRVS